jgi:hypothetical protein
MIRHLLIQRSDTNAELFGLGNSYAIVFDTRESSEASERRLRLGRAFPIPPSTKSPAPSLGDSF